MLQGPHMLEGRARAGAVPLLRDSDKWEDLLDGGFVCSCGGWKQWCCSTIPHLETGYAQNYTASTNASGGSEGETASRV